jgi:hypothetical protein
MDEAYMDAAAAAIGLPIAAAHRAGVLHYLQLVAAMAPRVMEFPLTVDDESAAVFVPVVAPHDGAAP